jgi:sulfur-carrier protein adenylyltransferase/sulfurtransferase
MSVRTKYPPLNAVSLSSEFFQKISSAGAKAPSGDNLQPWSFAIDGDGIVVWHDSRRDQSLFNVRHLASYIALGAVLENIDIAASDEGYQTRIELAPKRQNDDAIARITFHTGAARDPLAGYIDRRCTNRRAYAKTSLSAQLLENFDVSIRFPALALHWVQKTQDLRELGAIVSRADRMLFENQLIHDHLFSTLRWNQAEVERTRDGLPIDSLELGIAGSLAFRGLKEWSVVSFLNRFGFSKAAANHSFALMRHCSAAGLVTTPDMSPWTFLQAGQAFQRIWLQVTKEGLALQPMTAVIFLQLRSRLRDHQGLTERQIQEVAALNRDFTDFFSLRTDRVPAMLFRIGLAPAPSARTIRRVARSHQQPT